MIAVVAPGGLGVPAEVDDVTTDDGKRFAGLGGSGGGTKFGDVKMAGSACEAGGGGGSGLCFVLTRFTTVAWERNPRKLRTCLIFPGRPFNDS